MIVDKSLCGAVSPPNAGQAPNGPTMTGRAPARVSRARHANGGAAAWARFKALLRAGPRTR